MLVLLSSPDVVSSLVNRIDQPLFLANLSACCKMWNYAAKEELTLRMAAWKLFMNGFPLGRWIAKDDFFLEKEFRLERFNSLF